VDSGSGTRMDRMEVTDQTGKVALNSAGPSARLTCLQRQMLPSHRCMPRLEVY